MDLWQPVINHLHGGLIQRGGGTLEFLGNTCNEQISLYATVIEEILCVLKCVCFSRPLLCKCCPNERESSSTIKSSGSNSALVLTYQTPLPQNGSSGGEECRK